MAFCYGCESLLCFLILAFHVCPLLSQLSLRDSQTVQSVESDENEPRMTTRFAYNDPLGTTPAVCPRGTRCAFQVYDKVTKVKTDFMKYCNCADGLECRSVGFDLSESFDYYYCLATEDTPTTVPYASSPEIATVRMDMDDGTYPPPNDASVGSAETSRSKSDRVGPASPVHHNEL